jgi:hypothetical protein
MGSEITKHKKALIKNFYLKSEPPRTHWHEDRKMNTLTAVTLK